MRRIATAERRWLTGYVLALAMLAGLALAVYWRLPTYRNPPFDFRTMAFDERLATYGLTRRQEGSIKLGFAEAFQAPAIGVYGNHIFAGLSAEAFGWQRGAAELFFNYTYANLSLPEIHRYLRHVERLGRLPAKLILVQITPPNADNGRYIINWGNELPPDVLLGDVQWEGLIRTPPRLVAAAWELVNNGLHEVLNYNTFIWGLLQGGGSDRLIGPRLCHQSPTPWFERLPAKLRTVVGLSAGRPFFCQPEGSANALARDGSLVWPEWQLVRDEDPLNAADRGLTVGDEVEIARQMRSIRDIGQRHNIKVVFVVPPVYETDRRGSVVNRILDRSLQLAPEVDVIDNRDMHADPSLFATPIHAGPKYFGILAEQLRSRGHLD